MLSAILATASVDELAVLMSREPNGQERGMAVNFLNLASFAQGEGGLKTIEFRQHEASLDAGVVGAWVGLVAGLVGRAHALGRERVVGMVGRDLVRRGVAGGERGCGIGELLAEVGLGPLGRYLCGEGGVEA